MTAMSLTTPPTLDAASDAPLLHPALRPRKPGLIHKAALALVFAAIASSAVVFSEPAPVDVLMMGLIVLLPVVGLTSFRPGIVVLAALLAVMGAGGFVAATFATDTAKATIHHAVTIYLYASAVVIAAFVARRPESHTRLILKAFLIAASFAALAGIVGYLGLLPGASELLTEHGRASGTFKDPNVFGPFLVPPLLYTLHLVLARPVHRLALPLALMALLCLGVLLSFSRGAWINLAIGLVLYAFLYFVTAPRDVDRIRLIALASLSSCVMFGVLAVALQDADLSHFLQQRSVLFQTYDQGPEGRFGGQEKAVGLVAQNPLGIGSMEFPAVHHHEDVHNVYLTVLLSTGWIGGLVFIALNALTLGLGLAHALRRTPTQPLFLVIYAALAAVILEGMVIDSDHWRHYYLLLGMTWGLMFARHRRVRTPTLVADTRHVLLGPVIVVPPTRRPARLLRRAPVIVDLTAYRRTRALPRPRRPVRLVRPAPLPAE